MKRKTKKMMFEARFKIKNQKKYIVKICIFSSTV